MMLLASFAASALLAQDITGTWQGTLQAGKALRVVIKISSGDGALKAMMYSIDQGGQGLPDTATAVAGSNVKISIAAIGRGFEGKLNTDLTSMAGTWSQGPDPSR